MDAKILKTQAKELTGSLRDLGSKKEKKYREKTKSDADHIEGVRLERVMD